MASDFGFSRTASLDAVKRAYGARAQEYADAFGAAEALAFADVELITGWARGLSGPAGGSAVLDVGCGPGQWTQLLSEQGVAARGIDPVVEFIDLARERYPDQVFSCGSAQMTGSDDGVLDGVLCWYALIHGSVADLREALREFRRILRVGGGLALGFFEGPVLEPFGHAVTTANFWPMAELVREVEAAGFTVIHTGARSETGVRRHGELLAIRDSGETAAE